MQAYREETPGVRHCLIGTCAWVDDNFKRRSHFFPASAQKSAELMLKHYSEHFQQVEIDTSTYAIPGKTKLQEWVETVPPGFTFHIKAFGFLCSRGGSYGSLPRDLRDAYLAPSDEAKHLRMSDLPPEMVDALWERFNSAVDVLHGAGKLGAVLFQFHASSLGPTLDNMAYLAECRLRLCPAFPMAVEFRERAWYSTGRVMAQYPLSSFPVRPPHIPSPPAPWDIPVFTQQRAATLYFMRRLGLVNVAADELGHEYPPHEPAQPCMPDGRVLISEDLTSPACAYIRIHRREGDMRLLPKVEVREWAGCVQRMATSADGMQAYASACGQADASPPIVQGSRTYSQRPEGPLIDHPWFFTHLAGPICINVATYHDDQPLVNMKAIAAAIGAARSRTGTAACMFDWHAVMSARHKRFGLEGFFARAGPEGKGKRPSEAAGDGGDSEVVAMGSEYEGEGEGGGAASPVLKRPRKRAEGEGPQRAVALPSPRASTSASHSTLKGSPPTASQPSLKAFFQVRK